MMQTAYRIRRSASSSNFVVREINTLRFHSFRACAQRNDNNSVSKKDNSGGINHVTDGDTKQPNMRESNQWKKPSQASRDVLNNYSHINRVESDTTSNKSTSRQSWRHTQRKKNYFDSVNRHGKEWRSNDNKSNANPSSDAFRSTKNLEENSVHSSRTSLFNGERSSSNSSEKIINDLKDISALRNTFMPSKSGKPYGESWRTPLASTKDEKILHPSHYDRDDKTIFSSFGSFNKGKAYGKNSRPSNSFTLNKQSSSPSKLTNLIADGTHSLEQVLQANAIHRKREMEQKYRNAGEYVPNNLDMYGSHSGLEVTQQSSRRSDYRHVMRDSFYQGNKPSQNNNQQIHQPQQHKGQITYQKRQQQRNNKWRSNQNHRRQLIPSSIPKSVRLPSTPLTLVGLSLLLRVKKRTIVRSLRSLGESMPYTALNQDSFQISPEMMEYVCVDLGLEPLQSEKKESSLEKAERRVLRQSSVDLSNDEKTLEEEFYSALPRRSPVVSIMGHVDHGKTTLMDALRRRAVAAKASGGKEVNGLKKNKKELKSRGNKNLTTLESDNVAGAEAGGITQVITAFEVPLPLEESSEDQSGDSIENSISTVTFLDTPGHAAFKKMRQSGSSATDVIVLVIAADDGVSQQTIEILNMFKSIARSQPGSISLVVAVSKIDKPGIDVEDAVRRIEYQLIEHDIFTENVLAAGEDEGEFGACQLFPISGLTGEGLDDLVEGLALQSELMDLRADYEAKGEGIVIDARMEKGLGVVADCVIRWGKVEQGDFVVSGNNGGKVKFLNDVTNKPLKRARPSQPVRIVGFKTLPNAGDAICCATSEDEAKELLRLRETEKSSASRAEFDNDVDLQVTGTAAKQSLMLQKVHERYGFDNNEDDKKLIRIPVLIKADSHGALEAVRDALVSIGTESKLEIVIDPVAMGTGVVTTSDVRTARESDAAIFVFGKVGIADKETKALAESEDVSIRSHDIIYRLLEDAKDFFVRYLPVTDEVFIHGKANVQAIFEVTDVSKKSISIAGLRVTDGSLFKAKSKGGGDGGAPLPCFYRVIRRGEMIVSEANKLKAISLRKVKEDVDSVRRGDECGLGLDGFNDVVEGDVVECYSIVKKYVSL